MRPPTGGVGIPFIKEIGWAWRNDQGTLEERSVHAMLQRRPQQDPAARALIPSAAHFSDDEDDRDSLFSSSPRHDKDQARMEAAPTSTWWLSVESTFSDPRSAQDRRWFLGPRGDYPALLGDFLWRNHRCSSIGLLGLATRTTTGQVRKQARKEKACRVVSSASKPRLRDMQCLLQQKSVLTRCRSEVASVLRSRTRQVEA